MGGEASGAFDQAGLLRAARGGDVAAFNELVRHHQRQVYTLCFRTLGNPEDAADASQDAFLGAYRGLAGFDGSAEGFRAWLVRIAVNACYDLLRRRKRRPADSLDAPGSWDDEGTSEEGRVADPAPGPEQRALSAETVGSIQAALARLPPDQRLTVVLCDVQGFSYDEAARAMGVELGTVKSRLSRARAALRDQLAARGELPSAARRLAC